jgi:hypothetical protein
MRGLFGGVYKGFKDFVLYNGGAAYRKPPHFQAIRGISMAGGSPSLQKFC